MRYLDRVRPIVVAAAAVGIAACASSGTSEVAAPAPESAPSASADAFPTTPPPPLEERPLDFPPFEESELANGLRIIVVEQADLPIANVSLFVESGSASDPQELAGLSGVLSDMLTKGTPTRSAEDISREIERVGGTIWRSAPGYCRTISSLPSTW